MSTAAERRKRETHRRQIDVLGVALRKLGSNLLLYHRRQAEKLGLNPTDSRAMGYLGETGPIPAGRLAELMGLTTGAVTGVLDRLEAAGVVRRRKDPGDRRRVLVAPVVGRRDGEAGRRLFAPLARPLAELARTYGEDELDVILDFVTRTSKLLGDESRRPPPEER
ncbi:MAG TPA: MarR family transcriptional regulator [Longimicrobiales bacterium]|nr:MarR family transcriptional regulator [Longimicrobiales bacterium]